MTTFKSIIIATAAAAILLPAVGTAHAKHDKKSSKTQLNAEDRRDYGHDRRDNRRDTRGNRWGWGYWYSPPRDRFARLGTETPWVDRMIDRQGERIRRGRQRGLLTRIERVRLRGHLSAIRTARRIAKLDGRISRRERRGLVNMVDANAERIRRMMRNHRTSF